MKALVIALSLLLTGAASASTLILVKRGGDDEPAATSAPSQHASAAGNPHPMAGQFEPDATRLAECDAQPCYERAFGNIAYRQGPKAALRIFDERIGANPAVEAGCHRIVHTIGSASLARYDGNVARAFAEGSASCWSGYYHGILSFAFAGVTDEQKLGAVSRGLCDDAEIRRTTHLAYQCVHGLGHGLMLHTGYNLPFALQTCDKLATDWDRKSCSGGVFMENITPSLGTQSKWLKKNDLVYPCNAVKDRHKLYCYLMVTSRILQANGYDWKEAAALCTKVERGWVATCFQSYGRDASGFTRQSPQRVLELCLAARGGTDECVYGAARDMTSNYANGERASQLCKIAPAAMRARCFNGIGTVLGGLAVTSADRQSACRGLTRRYVRDCLSGTGEPV